jgi:hypothetical protein
MLGNSSFMRGRVTMRCAAALALSAGASTIFAQGPIVQPKCWFWSPPETTNYPLPSNFTPILRPVLLTDTTPQEAVEEARQQYLYFRDNGWIPANPADRVAFFVQNAKSSGPTANKATKLYVPEDRIPGIAVNDATAFHSSFVDNGDFLDRNPYFEHSSQEIADWWTEFREAWHTTPAGLPALPKIDRAHFDAEQYAPTDMFDARGAYLLYQMQNNASDWQNKDVFGLGKSMAQLWNEVKNKPGFYVPSTGQHDRPLYLNFNYKQGSSLADFWIGFAHDWDFAPVMPKNNRLIGLWYNDICQQTMAAVKNQSCFAVLRHATPGDDGTKSIVTSNFKSSNYQYSYIRPGNVDFGWEQRDVGANQNNQAIIDPVWKRVSQRGFPVPNEWGFDMTQLSPMSTDPTCNKQWLAPDSTNAPGYEAPLIASDDSMSSPVLYAVGSNNLALPEGASWSESMRNAWTWYRQRDAYKPAHPIDADRWAVSLRQHRMRLESTIASEGERVGGSPWNNVVPWIIPPNLNAVEFNNSQNAYFIKSDDCSRQLALLRSKRISEIMVWNPTDDALPDTYGVFTEQFANVYEPYLISITDDEGGQSSSVFDFAANIAPSTAEKIDAVEDTNERWRAVSGQPFIGSQKVLRLTNNRNNPNRTAMTTKIDVVSNVVPPVANVTPALNSCQSLRLTLECSVTVNDPSNTKLSHLEGRIRFIRPNENMLFDVTMPPVACGSNSFHEVSASTPELYGFWAPRTHPTSVTSIKKTPSACQATSSLTSRVNGSYNVLMRRTFDITISEADRANLLNSAGNMKASLLVRAISHNGDWDPNANITVDWNLIQITRRPLCESMSAPGIEATAASLVAVDDAARADVDLSGEVNAADISTLSQAIARGLPSADYNNDGAQNQSDVIEAPRVSARRSTFFNGSKSLATLSAPYRLG